MKKVGIGDKIFTLTSIFHLFSSKYEIIVKLATFKSKFDPEDVDFSKNPFGSWFFKILSTFRI